MRRILQGGPLLNLLLRIRNLHAPIVVINVLRRLNLPEVTSIFFRPSRHCTPCPGAAGAQSSKLFPGGHSHAQATSSGVAFWAIHSITSSGTTSSHEAREPHPRPPPHLRDNHPARRPSATAQLHSIRRPPAAVTRIGGPGGLENLASPSSRDGRPDGKRVTGGHSHPGSPGPSPTRTRCREMSRLTTTAQP